MAMYHFPRTLAWDASRTAPATDGIRVVFMSAAVNGVQYQPYDAFGNAMTEVLTEGFTVPDVWLSDVGEAWCDAGAGRFKVEAVDWVTETLEEVQAAVAAVGSFEARLAAVEASGGGGGGTGGGSQLGLVEDVFTIATENGSTLIGADGTSIARTSFTYAEVPVGHRLVIKDHPDYAASAVQPLLPAAFWGEAAKANPQAEFVSFRTPVAA